MQKDVYDKSKLAFHKGKLEALARGEITAPVYVRIKPTNRCNHACFYCPYIPGSSAPVSETVDLKDEIPFGKLVEVLSDFQEIGVKAVTYSGGGEPLIHPSIAEIMRRTLDNKIELSMITNGQELYGKRAEILSQSGWVRVSSSESDAETFKEARKRPESWFYVLGKNIKDFARIKKPGCELGINFVVQKTNAEKVYRSVEYFRDLGAGHIKITPCWFPNFLEYHSEIKHLVLEQIARARQDFECSSFRVYDTYDNDFRLTGINERTYPRCHVLQIVPVIGADSNVYFCHDKTYSKNGVLGSIRNRSFKELWFSEEAAKIIRSFDPRKGCRHHCTYDRVNLNAQEMLRDLENLDKHRPESDKHKNFI